MQLIKIAWRNLTRNKMRTFIAVAAIASVVTIVIFSRAFMSGATETIFGLYIDNNYGHVRVTTEEYNIRETILPLDYTITGFNQGGAEEMNEMINQINTVNYTVPRIRFGSMASVDGDLVRMLGVGVDYNRESTHGVIPDEIVGGRMAESGNELVIGIGLLDEINRELNDTITLMFSDSYQSLQGRTFEIVGIRDTGITEIDDNFFYLPLGTAQEMLYLDDQYTELMVFGDSTARAAELKADIEYLLSEQGGAEYIAQTFREANPIIETFDEVYDMMNFVYVLFILMGTIVIISVLTMIVRERTSEIGMLSALGLKARDIMKIFILEGGFMGVIGSILGVVTGGLITYYYSINGLYVEEFANTVAEADFLMEPVFHLSFSLENLIFSFILSTIIVTLACFYPAFKASKMDPAEAIHHVEE